MKANLTWFKTRLFCTAALLTLLASANAQYVLKEADAQFTLGNYFKAGTLYEQAFRKKASLHAAERAAESYSAQRNFNQVEDWYAIASKMDQSSPKNVLEYAKALQNNGKYNEAKDQYKKYIGLDKTVSEVQRRVWLESCDSATVWMRSPTEVRLVNQKKLNSKQSDWAAVKQLGGVVFVSDRALSGKNQHQEPRPFLKFDGATKPDPTVFGGTGNGYFNLFEKSSENDSVKVLSGFASSDYNVGPASFTADGKEMYFAQSQGYNTIGQTRKQKSIRKVVSLSVEIFASTKDSKGNWTKAIPFKYNKPSEYSVGDPFISSDGSKLFFCSDMPGGKGGLDLYMCYKTKSGDWSKPQNIKELNSIGNDRSPNLAPNGFFYFSSDGRIGMGGLDIYKSIFSGNHFSVPINMHYPINSPQDDFAFNFYNDTEGYLSSNRVDGTGDDDIYSFGIKKADAVNLVGKVLGKGTNIPLANAIVTIKKMDGELMKFQTDQTGVFEFKLEAASSYQLSAEKTGYTKDNSSITTTNLKNAVNLEHNLYLQQIVINQAIRLENIYYDFNKANILPASAKELDKLVKIMLDNPTIWIELGSHTDSRGSDAYNLKLSQRRADAAVQYIISRGVEKNRIEAKGYGETKPVNGCKNGVKCSEADYQLNRRTEFKITKQ